MLQPLDVDINAKRGPIKNWIGMDNVQAGIHRLFREFLQTFSLQGEHVYQGRLREMCSCAPCCPTCICTCGSCSCRSSEAANWTSKGTRVR